MIVKVDREQLLKLFRRRPVRGVTQPEVADLFRAHPSSVCRAFDQLHGAGKIKRGTTTRRYACGAPATAWVLTAKERRKK